MRRGGTLIYSMTPKKNLKPLTYLVHPSLMDSPEIQERIAAGHIVHPATDVFEQYDAVIGPNCYRISAETIHLLDIVDKAVRRMKYPPKAKKTKATKEADE